MKKFLALILSVLMLASCFVLGTSAAETLAMTATNTYTIPDGYSPIAVTHVSAKTVYNSKGETADWSGSWGLLDTAQTSLNIANYNGSGTQWEIVGKFNPSTVEKLVFSINTQYSGRYSGITVELSADNVTYDTIGTTSVSHLSSGPAYATCDIPEEYRSTEYQYVRLSKNATGWLGFNSVVLLTSTADIKAMKTAPEGAEYQAATYVGGYCDNASKIWDLNNTSTVDDTATTWAYSDAKFENPVVISKVEFLTGATGARARGGAIYGSEDGINWDKLATMPDTMANDMTYTLSVITNKAYEYIRVGSQESWTFAWSAVQCRVYGWAETDDRAEVVSYESSPAGESANVWADDNTTVHKGTDNDDVTEYTTATLENPTVVTDIYFSQTTASGRNRQIQFLGSVDGENWVRLAYNWRANNTTYNNSTQHYEIANPVAVKYIKVDNSLMGDWYWNIANVAVYGNSVSTDAIKEAAVYGGAQTKIDSDAGTYSVRFLATIDESALANQEVGFIISATYGASPIKEQIFTIPTSTAYSKVKADNVEYAATDLVGGANNEYICAVVLNGVSIEKYDNITFVVQTYVKTANGAVVYGGMNTVVINDGAEVK